MRVGIWDLSYYQNHKGQNAELMKISSYHKQIGDSVNLFEDIVDTKRQYELIYIYRDNDELPMPPIQFMNKSNVRLMGNGFKYFKT